MIRRIAAPFLAVAFLALVSTLGVSCGGGSAPAGPGTPTPTAAPTATPTNVPCGNPVPPPISEMGTKIHLRTGLFWTLDSTPLIRDRAYCKAIGFTDGRLR